MNRMVRAGEVLDVVRFEAMSREDCIDEWRRTMGGQSLKYVSVQFMRSALAYEAQIEAHGGHSNAVRSDLAPRFYPALSSFPALVLPS
jgi:hypothetical protein